jgi:tRNA-splicing ligase RtcB
VWLFLHSGSRGVGNRLAQHHINISKAECENIKLPNRDLAYLIEGTDTFGDYIQDLNWAQRFAYLNREEMMDRVTDCFSEFMGFVHVDVSEKVNCHHNYTEQVRDSKYGNFWLSRKGAINAEDGTPGLIPGSMGDKSYVVQGLGDVTSLWSAPHGAGRIHSRSSAKATFTRDELDASMKGIVWGNSNAFIDEIPGAYKPIDQVMADAKGLVEVKYTLKQILNVKGS